MQLQFAHIPSSCVDKVIMPSLLDQRIARKWMSGNVTSTRYMWMYLNITSRILTQSQAFISMPSFVFENLPYCKRFTVITICASL